MRRRLSCGESRSPSSPKDMPSTSRSARGRPSGPVRTGPSIAGLLHAAGLPRPVLQHEIRDAGGRLIGRADLAWPDRSVLVEFDGEIHRERDVFVNDLRRQNQLVAAGWIVLRFSSADLLGRPDEVIAEIRPAPRAVRSA